MRIRCYLPPERWSQTVVPLNGREVHHLAHVLRVRAGLQVTCFDGQGTRAQAIVRSVTRKGVWLELGPRQTVPPPSWKISLAVAVPKKGRMDQIVDQATQLGVHRLIPLLTARGVVRISTQEWPRRQQRLHQIAIEAAKQAGVDRLPVLDPAIPWNRFLLSLSGYDRILIATLEGPHEEPSDLLSDPGVKEVLLMIGPEGDWTAQEIKQAAKVGSHRISLGPTVLRCETAVVSGLSIVATFLRRRLRQE
jgi:16S rRNA (uracil1498-N3)-methyltransferase